MRFVHKSNVLLSSNQIMDSIEQAVSHTKQPSASSFDFSHRKLFGAKELLSGQRINAKDYMRCSQKINFLFPKYAKKLSIQNFSYFIISLHKS